MIYFVIIATNYHTPMNIVGAQAFTFCGRSFKPGSNIRKFEPKLVNYFWCDIDDKLFKF